MPGRRRILTPAQELEALALHRQGLTSNEIGARLGCSGRTVRHRLQGLRSGSGNGPGPARAIPGKWTVTSWPGPMPKA